MNRLPANRYILFATLALVGLAWDLVSKEIVFTDLGFPANARPIAVGQHDHFAEASSLPDGTTGQSKTYIDGWVSFRLYTSFNQGALWGMGQGYSWLFALLSVAAAVGIVVWLFPFKAADSRWLTVALAFVMAGTLGNLYDRLGWHGAEFNGEPIHAVRDFLLFSFGRGEDQWSWPVFNFADVFLVTGAIMLVLQSFRAEPKKDEAKSTGHSKSGSHREVAKSA